MINIIPVKDFVAAISVGIVKGKKILDLDYSEDSTAEVDMNIVKTASGKFVEIQGTAESDPFNEKQLISLLALADKGIRELVTAQKKVVGAI